jgi:predicted Kef-type K+ transport protein
MKSSFSKLLDFLSDFIATRKGLLPIIGILCVGLNFLLGLFTAGWLASSDLFLHAGIIIAILGFLLAWAL